MFLFWTVMYLIFYFFLVITEFCSFTNGFLLSLPFAIMFLHLREYINIKVLLSFGLGLIIFGWLWNFLFVDFGRIMGWPWFISWAYEIYSHGKVIHSDVYLNKELHPNFWIVGSPISMSVYLPIAGTFFSPIFIMCRRWFIGSLRKIN